MAKNKSKSPNWSSVVPPTGSAARASTPVARAAETLHRAVGALLVQPQLPRLATLAPIEVELRGARDCAPSGIVHVAVDIREDERYPAELLVATGPSSFQQLAVWIYGRTGGLDAEEGPTLVLRDAQLMSLLLAPARDLSATVRRAQIGEALVLDGVSHVLVARHETQRRAGLTPDVEELLVISEVVEALTRALGDPAFEALPYDYFDATLTRLAADGSKSEIPWPDLSDEVGEALLDGQDESFIWNEVDDETRTALERRACALPSAAGTGYESTLVITLQCSDVERLDEADTLVLLEAGSLRELAQREFGPAQVSLTDPGRALTRKLGLVLDVLEGSTDGGRNVWAGGAPKLLILELAELHRPLLALLGEARSAAGLGSVDVELSEADQAAARYLEASRRLAGPPPPDAVDPWQLAGALAFIEHRSEHIEGGWEVELLAFLDDEEAEHILLQGGVQEGRIAGARSYRLLRAVADCSGAAAWLPQLMGKGVLPEVLARGLAAWADAAPDFYVRESNGTTFRALAAGTAGVQVPEVVLDDLPDFDFDAEVVPLWRASLGAAERFVPAGRPMPLALAREILAEIEARHGDLGDAARRASAAQLLRRTFVKS